MSVSYTHLDVYKRQDQYQIASAARVATVPTGEVGMVCCEDSDTVFENIKKALAA